MFSVGLSDSASEGRIDEAPGNLGGAHINEVSGVGGKKVQLIALDEIVGLGDGQKIDFIKMDVEGHELSVLWGGTRLIKREQPLLAIEILNKAKPQIRPKIVEELKKLSYQFFHEFTPRGLFPSSVPRLGN